MKKRLAILFGSAMLIAAVPAATAFASHDYSGVQPGDPNCHGQIIAALAHDVGVHGLGEVSEITGLSVKEIQDIIKAVCA